MAGLCHEFSQLAPEMSYMMTFAVARKGNALCVLPYDMHIEINSTSGDG
jgi:hypothetical protein